MINITTNQLAEILAKILQLIYMIYEFANWFASGHIPDSHNLPLKN